MSQADVDEQIARREIHGTVNLVTATAGLLQDRGPFDASGNVFPSAGGSGQGGAILQGDTWRVSVAGTLGGNEVNPGAWLRAMVDAPGQTAGNWGIANENLSYTAENEANKSTDIEADTGSDIKYPSVAAVESAVSAVPDSQALAATETDGFPIYQDDIEVHAAGTLAARGIYKYSGRYFAADDAVYREYFNLIGHPDNPLQYVVTRKDDGGDWTIIGPDDPYYDGDNVDNVENVTWVQDTGVLPVPTITRVPARRVLPIDKLRRNIQRSLKFVGRMQQTGTDAPVLTVILHDDFGDITLERDAVGQYRINSSFFADVPSGRCVARDTYVDGQLYMNFDSYSHMFDGYIFLTTHKLTASLVTGLVSANGALIEMSGASGEQSSVGVPLEFELFQ